MPTAPLRVAVTVDFEPDCPPYLSSTFRGIEQGAPALLSLFAEHNVPATFFTTGEVAEKYPEAVEAFRAAAAAEPYNATAAYGLATALTRSGDPAARAAMDHFQALRASGYAVTYSQAYLEQGRYGEAVASTGAEAELVDPRTPDVGFIDATAQVIGTESAKPSCRICPRRD